MCNYNMEDTIERALRSILGQLNDDYEVVLVDDGSRDNSVTIVKKLQEEYPILRLIELTRNPKRFLGETRNISIREATGEYALLNIDCDDIYGPHIQDFVKIFHQIEAAVGKDFYFKGGNINIAKRSFLLEHGPYRNIYHLEDRDMWFRFAAINSYIQMDHTVFVTRLPKPKKERIRRAFHITWSHMLIEFRRRTGFFNYVMSEPNKWKNLSLKRIGIRMILLLPAYFTSFFQTKISLPVHMNTDQKFANYREKNRGTFADLMKKYKGIADYSILSPQAKDTF